MTASKLVLNAASGAGSDPVNIEDIFSTFTYDANGGSTVVENGIALGNTGDGGSAYFHSTTGDSVDVAASSDFLFDGDFTIEFFYHASLVATWNDVFGYGTSTNFYLEVRNNGQISTGGFGSSLSTSSGVVDNGVWNHIALVRSGSDTHIYCNGSKEHSSTEAGSIGSSSQFIRIGNSGENFTGYLSNFRIVKGTAVYSGNTYTVPTSALTAITNTKLLLFQGTAPFTDNSGTSKTITKNGGRLPIASNFGPFTGSSGEGGLVWIKGRMSGGFSNYLFDTARGVGKWIKSDETNNQATDNSSLSAFNSNGFTLGTSNIANYNTGNFVSWTFRKQPKFFDIVTYTGNSTARTISHNLGSVPGMIILKSYGDSSDWIVYHRSNTGAPQTDALKLHSDIATTDNAGYFNDTAPTSTEFSLGDHTDANGNGKTFVAYLFAHNDGDGDFGPDGDKDVIKCGSYTGNGASTGTNSVNLGFEPQFIMIKRSDSSGNWVVIDNMRGMLINDQGNDALLQWDTNSDEAGLAQSVLDPTPTGFNLRTAGGTFNGNGGTYLYMAIRRGPLAVPEDATKVFAIGERGQNGPPPAYYAGFAPDFFTNRSDVTSTTQWYTFDRLRGRIETLFLDANTDEQAYGGTAYAFDQMYGIGQSTNSDVNNFSWMWKRAPGYFDITTWTGTGSAITVNHNLGAVPKMIWVKRRDSSQDWVVYHAGNDVDGDNQPWTDFLRLDNNQAGVDADYFNDTAPTATTFQVKGYGPTGAYNGLFIAYLFGEVDGVTKLGNFTADGSNTVNVDCGFSNGARFVMIKKISGSGNWYVFDTARGAIVSGNDKALFFDITDAQQTAANWIEPLSSGFQLVGTAWGSGTYIFYAIA